MKHLKHRMIRLQSVFTLAFLGLMLSAVAAPKRPNIVFILVDDVRWDALGRINPFIRTPNLDDMAAKGVHFKNAFTTTPICAASRATILTGVWEKTHGCNFPGLRVTSTALASQAYPKLLRESGYTTGHVGKYGLTMVDDNFRASLFDSYDDGGCMNNTTRAEPQMLKEYQGRKNVSRTDIETDKAIDFIRANAAKPFCLQLSYHAAHAQDDLPVQYPNPPSYDSLYAKDTMPTARQSDDASFAKLPKFLQTSRAYKHYMRRFDTPPRYQTMVKAYYRMITHIDDSIGRIRKSLEELRISDNTVLIYISDNGYFLGEWRLADKYYGWEESLRVPLIILDPRKSAAHGASVAEVALNVDITPTILDLAGVKIPGAYQGASLLPLVNGAKPKTWRSEFYFEQHFDSDVHAMQGLRTPRWKYFNFYKAGAYEYLFDLEKDPGETQNIAGDAKHAATLADLRAKTAGYIAKYSAAAKN